mmetsp:Transcript_799/g.1443  ORF Transcript_799/g.1443 Transcript_799/m.1443 type:complete len:388 (+) Transcript_799:290-1453(+)|eukprot:CAMPEP_0197474596 /NCGR_PEP_ID=MMETSP1309-20131121/6050_1 /TAXON_ID=464262 /ORGANISM="Genus nov. species nov., Strain RCC998" /LENGTH=387 /DNA_ID=CAMNT_0043014305 /DNA_START=281 /DNA_END=1444 /DNA_ORIENTATION=-
MSGGGLMSQRGESKKGYTAATVIMILVQLAFAGWHVLGKVALNTGVSPLFFALIREGGASLVLLLLAGICDKRPRMPTKPEALVFLTLGVLIFINIVGFILALNLVEPITAAIYQPLIPVWTAFWAVLFRVEPANPYMLTGIAISVSGAVVAAMSESHGSHDEGMPPDMPKDMLRDADDVLGVADMTGGMTDPDLLAEQQSFMQKLANNSLLGHGILLIQTLALGTLYLVQKQIVHEFPSLTSTAWYYSIGSFLTIVMCIGYFQSLDAIVLEFSHLENVHVLIAFIYAVVVGTAFTYGGSTWANKKLDASIVSLYTVLQSPFTLLLSICFLGSKPEFQDLVCMVLIIFGMVLVVGSKMKPSDGQPINDVLDYEALQVEEDEEDKRND